MSSGSVEPCGSQAAWHLQAVWLTDSSDETGESHGGSKQTLGFGNPCHSHKMALIGGMRTLQVKLLNHVQPFQSSFTTHRFLFWS